MIRFDDLHHAFSRKIYVPFIADIMATRWAYEAISVEQFKSNKFQKPFFRYDMALSQNNWYSSFLIPALKVKADECIVANKKPDYEDYSKDNFKELNFHLNQLSSITGIKPGGWIKKLNYDDYNNLISGEVHHLLDSMKTYFWNSSRRISLSRDSLYKKITSTMGEQKFLKLREENYNESLANILLNRMITDKIYDSGERLIQKADPVFMNPISMSGRAHFYAPFKQVGNLKIDTIIFNLVIIWIMVFILFVTLYYNVLKRFIDFLESLNLPFLRRFGRHLIPIQF
jgi:hypothetical protein